MKKMLIFMLLIIIPVNVLAEATEECVYDLVYPMYYCLNSNDIKCVDAGLTYDSIDGEYGCVQSIYGKDECKKRAGYNMKFATIKILSTVYHDSFQECLGAGDCDVLYKSTSKTVTGDDVYKSFGGYFTENTPAGNPVYTATYGYATDYEGDMTCYNCRKQNLGVDYIALESWYLAMKHDNICPDIFVKGKVYNNNPAIDITFSPNDCFNDSATSYIKKGKKICDINTSYVKLIQPGKQNTLNNQTGEMEDIKDVPTEDDPIFICEYTNFIGLGPLASATFNLKVNYTAWELQTNHMLRKINLKFSSGNDSAAFENIGDQTHFDINFPVSGLGNKFKFYINETNLGGYNTQSSMFGGLSCLDKDKEFYIFPKETKDGITTYEITDDVKKKTEYETEYQNSLNQKPPTQIQVSGFDFCIEDGVLKTFQIIGYLIIIIKILVPLLLIVFGSIDFGKAIIANDDKAINKSGQVLAIRAAAGVIIFFIPTIINFAVSLVSSWSDVKSKFDYCNTCLLNTGKCNDIRKDVCENQKNNMKISETEKTETKYSCKWENKECNCKEVESDK